MATEDKQDKQRQENERIGLIDVGSNTIRLVIFEIDTFDTFRELLNIKNPARLVQYIDNHMMTDEGVDILVDIMKNYADIADQYDIKQLIPIATAAVRQSDNAIYIVKRVYEETGIQLDILSEKKEAYYGNYAVRHTLPAKDGISVDIGGGSTELTLFKNKEVMATHSFPFGAVSLKQDFFEGQDHNDSKAIKKAQKWVAEQFKDFKWIKDSKVPVVGIGGSARNIAEVYQHSQDYPLAGLHGYVMDEDSLNETFDIFTSSSLKDLSDMDGLSSDRRDIIIPAAIVFTELFKTMDASNFIISSYGIREGLIIEYINQKPYQPYSLSFIQQQTVYRMAKQYRMLEVPAGHRMTIVNQLLSELERLDILKPSPDDVEFLHFGAALYYMGTIVEDNSESQHTYYLIANSNLRGFTHKERVKLALIASYKNRSLFRQYTQKTGDWFTKDELDMILYLGSITKFAEALNDSHVNSVNNIDLDKTDDGYVLTVTYSGNIIAEEYRAEKQRNHLERVLDDSVDIRFISQQDDDGDDETVENE